MLHQHYTILYFLIFRDEGAFDPKKIGEWGMQRGEQTASSVISNIVKKLILRTSQSSNDCSKSRKSIHRINQRHDADPLRDTICCSLCASNILWYSCPTLGKTESGARSVPQTWCGRCPDIFWTIYRDGKGRPHPCLCPLCSFLKLHHTQFPAQQSSGGLGWGACAWCSNRLGTRS